MDGDQFDAVLRMFGTMPSRRGVLTGLGGGLLTLLTAAVGDQQAEARKKRHTRPCAPCNVRKKGACKPQSDGTVCAGGTCQGGACLPDAGSPPSPPPPTPAPSPPPPVDFCAGKNHCAQNTDVTCAAAGTECFCFIRADTAASFCGTDGPNVSDCGSCAADTICVILGGACGDGFLCSSPCPDPL